MRFQTSEGLTASESVLAELCQRSFLRLWTYPNLFKKPGKELIDLLVVFKNDVILFSDKSCTYPNTGDPDLDWKRWFGHAIRHSAHQIHVAESWVRNHPDRIFLDAKAVERLPLRLPDPHLMRIHRVCVVTGAAERCRAATGRTGFAIDLDVVGDSAPYSIGRIAPQGAWVHVFDSEILQKILSELSTAPDFIDYLNKKVTLLERGCFRFAGAETDLLGNYLWNNRSFPEISAPYSLRKDLWNSLEADASYQAGRRENQISWFWDRLIEYITDHHISETLEFGNELDTNEHESVVRIMASEGRFHRRVLSRQIIDRWEKSREVKISSILPSDQADVAYVLLIGRGESPEAYNTYREDRGRELQLRCVAAKAALPERRYIVGIALDAPNTGGGSEDFLLIDTESWTDDSLAEAARIRSELGYFVPGQAMETHVTDDEYPRS